MEDLDKILEESGFRKDAVISHMDSIPFKSNKKNILDILYNQNDKYKDGIYCIIAIFISICILNTLRSLNPFLLTYFYGIFNMIKTDFHNIYSLVLVLLYTAVFSLMLLMNKRNPSSNF